MTEFTKEVELLAERDGRYTVYVFKDLNSGEFIMCTRLPNWQVPEIFIGDKGFLQYKVVRAGDVCITPTGETISYQYSNIYFMNFVKRSIVKNKEIIL